MSNEQRVDVLQGSSNRGNAEAVAVRLSPQSSILSPSSRSGPTWTEADLRRAWEAMAGATHVLIPTHVNTDGDGISSALAMAEIARAANPSVRVTTCIPDGKLPPTLDFIPGVETMARYTGLPLSLDDVDLIIAPDVPEVRRFGPLYDAYQSLFARVPTIIVDHHVPRGEEPALARFIDTSVIAVDSLIVRLCGQWGVPLTPLLATLLLTGMSSDSSSFMRVEGNGAPTFETLAALCDAGADYPRVMDGLRRRKTPGSVAIWGALLGRAAWIAHVLWTEVTPAVLMETGADESDGEGVINWLVGTRGVGAAVIFYQGQGSWRASLRSTAPAVDVAAFARQYGGGGHVMASGCTFAGGLPERDAFLTALVAYTEAGLARG
ncbi:MAG TPA: DHH family phosphoesterase [Thermomicrobiales bacterium]